MLNNTETRAEPWGAQLNTSLQVNAELFMSTFWVWLFSQLQSCPIFSCLNIETIYSFQSSSTSPFPQEFAEITDDSS